MDALIIGAAALIAAGLTFFSGFGLGTLLMPAFALFFPVEVAVAATAIVHLANNLFAGALVGRRAAWRVVVRFGAPAVLGALVGAWVLQGLADIDAIARYSIGEHTHEVTFPKIVVAVLIAAFAVLELTPRFESFGVPARWVPVGGFVSGFFGGLSGHQGALRSAFLARLGLSKEQFVATGKMAAILVDLARLAVYGVTLGHDWDRARGHAGPGLIAGACLAAFVGSLIGFKLLSKTTIAALRYIVGVMLLLTAAALGSGLI